MRNRYFEKWNRIVKIKISGNNINSYLKRVIKKKINIIRLIPISYKEMHVILKYSEYEKLLELKSIYEIVLLDNLGSKRLEDNVKKNSLLLLFLILGMSLIVMLSKMVFSIEVVHQDKNIRELLSDELKKYGIVKYSFKKNYAELEEIEKDILKNNKDKLEWIEISEYGTKYIVRIEDRKLNKEREQFIVQNIVSKKDAVLVRIEAIGGEKVKQINDFVNKGDVIISGVISRPDNTKVYTKALGSVYGEVWYEVKVDYPFVYQETSFTGRMKKTYALYFLNHKINLFGFDEYKSFETRRKVLVKSNFLDISFVSVMQYEVLVKDEVYTEDIVNVKAIEYIKDKLISDNKNIIEIRDVKILNAISDEDSISFDLFVRVVEDIGEIAYLDGDINLDKDVNKE